MIELQRLDHWVLTVADIEATCELCSTVLGCTIICFTAASGKEKAALQIGDSPRIAILGVRLTDHNRKFTYNENTGAD